MNCCKLGFLAVPQVFRHIDHHRGQTRPVPRSVRRKPDVGQEYFARVATPRALHLRAEQLRAGRKRRHAGQSRQIIADARSRQLPRTHIQQMMRRFVRQQHSALCIECKNRRRAALHQDAQLLLRVPPQLHFVFQIGHVRLRQRAILIRFVDKQSRTQKRRENQDFSRDAFPHHERKRIERFHQERTNRRRRRRSASGSRTRPPSASGTSTESPAKRWFRRASPPPRSVRLGRSRAPALLAACLEKSSSTRHVLC